MDSVRAAFPWFSGPCYQTFAAPAPNQVMGDVNAINLDMIFVALCLLA